MSKNKNRNEERQESFFEKMKSDKKYSAKVQLLGYGVFLVILVIYLNLSSIGGGLSSNTVIGNTINSGKDNTSNEDVSLLEKLADNYSYDIVINFNKKAIDTETSEEVEIEHIIGYNGKSYGNKLEISKTVNGVTDLYYKVDNNYYNMIDNITSGVRKEVIYDVVDSDYIELDAILDFIDKSSLDHVTDYSNGKKVSVYHYKVLNEMSNYQVDEVVEIKIEEENSVLRIDIDYSNLFLKIDDSILECKLVATITNIGSVEEFDVVISGEENTSEE